MVEPLLVQALGGNHQPLFIRKITRRKNWTEPVERQDSATAASVFNDEQNLTSIWRVETDRDLRRVALALNEGRSSRHEEIFLIPIAPKVLDDAGLKPIPTPGESNCPEAKKLHFEVAMNLDERKTLAQLLMAAGTRSVRLTKPEMRAAEQVSAQEGCLAAVIDSPSCRACGATQ